MRVYFVDGPLIDIPPYPEKVGHFVNAYEGLLSNTTNIKRACELKHPIITNQPIALDRGYMVAETKDDSYGWDAENNKPDIYIIRSNRWVNIQDLTEKEIRPAHGILKMYLNGVFDSDKKEENK